MRLFLVTLCMGVMMHLHGQHSHASLSESLAKQELLSARVGVKGKSNPKIDSINIVYQDIYWDIDPSFYAISGRVNTVFKVKTNAIKTFTMDLDAPLVVDSINYHGTSITFQQGAEDVSVNLPSIIGAGQRDSVTIYYHGAPKSQGGFFRRTHNGTPEIWTLSQPYGASTWWPCKDGLNDKVDSLDLHITTPLGNQAISHGVLMELDTVGNEVTYHWKHRYPIVPYLVSVAVTNYVLNEMTITSGGQSFPMLDYAYPEDSAIASLYLPFIEEQFRVFDSLFIPYPFRNEKYGHAQSQIGGGMEHQTISTMGFFSQDLMAHELAHQWFGDYVTCGTWSDLWLNEGFATYLTGLNREFNKDSINWVTWKEGKINRIISLPGGSVYVTDTLNEGRLFSSRLTYDKAAMVLHMLRFQVGDSAFFAGCRNYLNQPELANNFVRNADLKWHLEQASGIDLTEFFNDWVFGEGYPSYEVVLAGSPNDYKVLLNQTQSHGSVSYFESPVELQVAGATRDTTFTIYPKSNNPWFAIPFDEPIISMTLNPNLWHVIGNTNYVLGIASPELTPITSFPNPVNETFVIRQESPFTPLELRVVNTAGSVQNVRYAQAGSELRIDTRNLPTGVYIVHLGVQYRPVKMVVSH